MQPGGSSGMTVEITVRVSAIDVTRLSCLFTYHIIPPMDRHSKQAIYLINDDPRLDRKMEVLIIHHYEGACFAYAQEYGKARPDTNQPWQYQAPCFSYLFS